MSNWVDEFIEEVEDPLFQNLKLMFISKQAFYYRLKHLEGKLLEQIGLYKDKQITQAEFIKWVRENVANEGSEYARINDSNPAFRLSTLWPWWRDWWEKLQQRVIEKKPGRKPKQ